VCLRLDRHLSFDSMRVNNKERIMGNPGNNHKINYIEFVSTDIEQTKKFYSTAFGWSFEDWGPEYISFSSASAGIDGGFRSGAAQIGSPLVVLYSTDFSD